MKCRKLIKNTKGVRKKSMVAQALLKMKSF